MTVLWTVYWPVVLATLIVGILAGRVGFRQRKLSDELSAADVAAANLAYRHQKRKMLGIGGAAALFLVAAWHWPLGGGSRFAGKVETAAADELKRVDTPEFTAKLGRTPLSRTLIVSGSANEFQKDGFVRLFRELPGVSRVRWNDQARGFDLPLFVEAALLSLAAFAVGLFFSWIVELRRRVNSYWNW
ncbi:hypothetical protein G7077_08775 [Sphingomonas piscis]|uniref:Uncharacterized protein n=1 Tax=Sphingomonas piscis TaxID=2714943 RepID=A0A6G7YQG7_9SPHN|nr:hypothetical protein [Sphingomonas piscis]QIK78976.1 hypothetical protein G7077_08775 [Sphingomonas piscis]